MVISSIVCKAEKTPGVKDKAGIFLNGFYLCFPIESWLWEQVSNWGVDVCLFLACGL